MDEWYRADPRLKTLWILSTALAIVAMPVLLALIAIPVAFSSLSVAGVLVGVAVGLVVVLGVFVLLPTVIYTFLFYRTFSYRVTEQEVTVRRGILFRTEIHIPLARIQDVVVKQGPLMRLFGLGALHLQTAAMVAGPYGQTGEGALVGIRGPQQAAASLLASIRARTKLA